LTNTLADMCFELGELTGARELYEEGLALWRDLSGQQGVAYSLGGLGKVLRAQGRSAAARTLSEEWLALERELGDRPNTAIALRELGLIALDLGNLGDARGRFIESLSLSRDLGSPRGIAFALEGLAVVAMAEERGERAVRLAGAAHALRTATGTHSPTSWHAELTRHLGPARQALGHDRWMTTWLSGQALTLERAITLALAEAEPQPGLAGPATGAQLHGNELSKREREIAMLVAQGLTSRQMAERLIVTVRTINTHLERIRDKLGVRSRAQITACVMRSGLGPGGGNPDIYLRQPAVISRGRKNR
jgi:non-specific serine/threonine protein kinase